MKSYSNGTLHTVSSLKILMKSVNVKVKVVKPVTMLFIYNVKI